MCRFDDALIKDAKESIMCEKKRLWTEKYSREHPEAGIFEISRASDRAEAEGLFKPKKGFITIRHKHGFIVMDFEGFTALPKPQQNKILKLSGA